MDDEFSLDVRVVVTTRGKAGSECPTDDQCGQTCENGASACQSLFDDLA